MIGDVYGSDRLEVPDPVTLAIEAPEVESDRTHKVVAEQADQEDRGPEVPEAVTSITRLV